MSLGCAIYSTITVHHLLSEGKRTKGVIIDVYSGAKGAKRAILEFTDQQGRPVKTRDYCQYFLVRPHGGEQVTVIYDLKSPETATIDLGIWIWQQPVAFYLGFLFLAAVGIFIFRSETKSWVKAATGPVPPRLD